MILRKESNQRMSQIVSHNGVIYLSGQVAKSDDSQDIAGQTQQILEQIEKLLSSAGSSKSNLLSVTIWLANIDDFKAMNDVWDEWVNGENPPARACVEARLARKELLVEMQVTASHQ